jgi:ribosomal protein S6--L-glutamate ligase
MASYSAPTIGFVLGKPVRPDTIFPEVFDRLQAMRIPVSVHVAGNDAGIADSVDAADLVVQRGLKAEMLRPVRDVEIAGKRCCNRVRATSLLTNRKRTNDLLSSNDLPVPSTVQLAEWESVVRVADGKPVAIKAADGRAGRGRGVLLAPDGRLPAAPPFDGPYVVQEFIEGGEIVYKLYVAGVQVRGLLKPSTLNGRDAGTPFQVDEALADLAVAAGRALELDIFGIDVLYGPDGPAIVDVNPFPGFRGVPDGPRLIADHLAELASVA